jgi:transcription elongation factor Elf1
MATRKTTSKPKLKKIRIPAVGKDLTCLVCGGASFLVRQSLLNTVGLTALGLDWANRTAACYVCGNCGHIHWFLGE